MPYVLPSPRERDQLLLSQLTLERSSFLDHWRTIGDTVLPRRPRFLVSDTNRGDRRNSKILDGSATYASRTLRAGMMGGITSPARPWFRLTTPDPDLAEFQPVKDWLFLVTQRMNTVFLRSNLYKSLSVIYGDLGTFATAAMMVEEDFTGSVIRTYPFPIGSYLIANNELLRVDVFAQEFRMTVRQLVGKFGYEQCSQRVQDAYDRGNYETWIDVCHIINPNPDRRENRLDAKYKAYRQVYYEKGGLSYAGYSNQGYLRESGFDLFPVLAPRWEVTGEDSYGTSCPGMEALGDALQLQIGEKLSLKAIEKQVNPSMVGPIALKRVKVSLLPGDVTYTDEREGTKGLRPAHEVRVSIQDLEAKQAQVRERINRAYYVDLFRMLIDDPRKSPPTAEEVRARQDEKLSELGQPLENINQDLLDPLIDLTFYYMNRQGLIPPAPEEIQGTPLRVEYVSVMAQAQKLVGIGGIERFASFVGTIMANTKDLSVLDKWDIDQTIDRYGDRMGVDPDIIRSDEAVEELRAVRAQAQQQRQVAEALPAVAGAAKDLAAADLSGDSALARLLHTSASA